MKFSRYFLIALIVLSAGCQNPRQTQSQIAQMGIDRRRTEDLLYATQDRLRERVAEVARLKKQNRQLREQLQPGSSREAPDPAPAPTAAIPIEMGAPERSVDVSPISERLESGSVVLPTKVAPVPADLTGPVTSQSRKTLPAQIDSLATGREVATRVFVEDKRSKVDDWDGKPGADGLSLVLGFVDAAAEPGRAAGNVVIRVFEDSDQPHEQSFADWEVSQQQMNQLLAASKDGRVRLELDWPGRRPADGKWIAMVEYRLAGDLPQQASYRFTMGSLAEPPQKPTVLEPPKIDSPAGSEAKEPDSEKAANERATGAKDEPRSSAWTPRQTAVPPPRPTNPAVLRPQDAGQVSPSYGAAPWSPKR